MNKTLSRVIICVTLLIILGVAGRYAYTEYIAGFEPAPVAELAPASRDMGSLIMTLKPSVPANSAAAIYALSVQNASLKKVDDSHDFYAPALSSDGRVAVVENTGPSSWQLVVAKVGDKETEMTVVPPAPAIFPGASSWSADNKFIVYDAVAALPSADDVAIDNSRVVLLDTVTGTQKILDIGVSPLFMKDGSVIYIKTDGVYRIDGQALAGTSTSAVVAARVAIFDEYSATRSARIALSHDENTVIVSLLHSGGSLVYSVVREPEFFMSEVGRMAGRALFPVFSPDDQSIAFIYQTEDKEGNAVKSLGVADVRTLTTRTILDLNAYTDEFLSLGAWVK